MTKSFKNFGLVCLVILFLHNIVQSKPDIAGEVCKGSVVSCTSLKKALNSFRKNPAMVIRKLEENY